MALLDRLRRKGKVQPGGGGRTIVQELEVALNPWGGWYAGFDLLSTNAFEPFSAAEYDWKQAYVPAVWNGREKLINQGKWATINLIEGRLKNSEKSLYDLVAQGGHVALFRRAHNRSVVHGVPASTLGGRTHCALA